MSELLQHFGIEWKLLLAQLVNFGVLFFVLRKFAYGPLLGMLRERREKIAEGMRAAEESQQKLAEANREKDALLGEARKESVSLIRCSAWRSSRRACCARWKECRRSRSRSLPLGARRRPATDIGRSCRCRRWSSG